MFDFSNLTRSTAVLEIIILMVVAAAIAFIVAWLYWRQKYRALEGEFGTYREQAEETQNKLNNELKAVSLQLNKCQEELGVTKTKLHDLRMVQIKLDTLETKHQNLEQEHAELVENYNGLLTKNAGLGARVRDLEKENSDQVTQLQGLNEEIGRLNAEVQSLVEQNGKLKGDLEAVTLDPALGMGVVQGLDANPVKGSGKRKAQGKKVVDKKVGGKKSTSKKKPAKKKRTMDEVLAEVASKRETINYALIGTASADDKEDLKKIKGIGPFIEKKLHALGIYTYAQIARFDDELVARVTHALEGFPGRIHRDNWIGQAREMNK